MSLETAAYISQLNASNPPAGDPIANAADHIRMIKQVLQDQFPNLATTAVTSTSLQLNLGPVPTGGIILWSGALTAVPTGWGLCNGSTYSTSDGTTTITSPNLENQFVIGAGGTYAVGATGGLASHTHNLTIAATSLSVAQIPTIPLSVYEGAGHSHGVNDPQHTHSDLGHQHSALQFGVGGNNVAGLTSVILGTSATGIGYANIQSHATNISLYNATTGLSVSTVGTAGATHTHTGSVSDTQPNLPPYYALAYIIKL